MRRNRSKTELEFLDYHRGQTLEDLLDMEDYCRVDSLVLAMEQGLQTKKRLTEAEETVLAVEALEREVNNGGFDQFFLNTPEHAPYIVDSLRRIGCPKTARLAEKAIKALGVKGQLTAKKIKAVIYDEDDARDDLLDRYDDVYYKGAEEPICDKLFVYVKANRARIKLVGPRRR
jgi:hypothetical protein